jgi:site-specific recombinase XerD
MRSGKNRNWHDMDKSTTQLADLVYYFDTFNRSEGKSPSTLRWYRQTLGLFLGWLIETGRATTLGDTGEYVVREFILWLQERRVNGHKLTVPTVNSWVRALRAFFNWLYQEGYTDSHLLERLRPPPVPRVMVDTLSDEEIASILASLDRSTMAGSRNTAILVLFLDTGLRLSELVGLKTKDIHMEDQYVKVMGKGSKERMVGFGSSARSVLLHYLVRFRGEPVHPGIEEFFLTIDGYPISQESVRTMLKRVGAAAGVPRLHAHLCRHTYATNFLINGGNVLLLKQNLGHTTLDMVDRYVHLATSKVAILNKTYSPMDRLGIRGLRQGRSGANGNRGHGLKVFHRDQSSAAVQRKKEFGARRTSGKAFSA